jgi:hypothetical protein
MYAGIVHCDSPAVNVFHTAPLTNQPRLAAGDRPTVFIEIIQRLGCMSKQSNGTTAQGTTASSTAPSSTTSAPTGTNGHPPVTAAAVGAAEGAEIFAGLGGSHLLDPPTSLADAAKAGGTGEREGGHRGPGLREGYQRRLTAQDVCLTSVSGPPSSLQGGIAGGSCKHPGSVITITPGLKGQGYGGETILVGNPKARGRWPGAGGRGAIACVYSDLRQCMLQHMLQSRRLCACPALCLVHAATHVFFCTCPLFTTATCA